MMKKNTINLNFNYGYWSAPVAADELTKSVTKMKKLLVADIKNVLAKGYKLYGLREAAMKFRLPFFPQLDFFTATKVKVIFADNCKFKCEKFSKNPKTGTESGEVTVDGMVSIEVVWKC